MATDRAQEIDSVNRKRFRVAEVVLTALASAVVAGWKGEGGGGAQHATVGLQEPGVLRAQDEDDMPGGSLQREDEVAGGEGVADGHPVDGRDGKPEGPGAAGGWRTGRSRGSSARGLKTGPAAAGP